MKTKIRLREILLELGIKTMVPTDKLLRETLGGMTMIRFNKLLSNRSKTELTLAEFEQLQGWLATITNQPAAAIALVTKEEAAV